MTEWRKSSRSGTGSQSDCVEVADLAGNIGIRDSKDPDGPRLSVGSTKFAALVSSIKAGALDL